MSKKSELEKEKAKINKDMEDKISERDSKMSEIGNLVHESVVVSNNEVGLFEYMMDL